jgi:hypothetical protein
LNVANMLGLHGFGSWNGDSALAIGFGRTAPLELDDAPVQKFPRKYGNLVKPPYPFTN